MTNVRVLSVVFLVLELMLQLIAEPGAARFEQITNLIAGESCSVHGHVYYDGVPVAGASVHIESPYGDLITSTADGGGGSHPSYMANLDPPPLLVSPGDIITITASYDGRSTQRAYQVAPGEQQVDIPIIINSVPLFGDGSDGDLMVNSGQIYYTDEIRTALNAAANAGETTVSVQNATGFHQGDEILVIQMQGVGTGSYEFATISSVEGGAFLLRQHLQNNYHIEGSSRSQVLLVPNYENVIVQSGGTLTVNEWNGSTGGVLALRSESMLFVEPGAYVSTSGKGYTGAGTNWNDGTGVQGESAEGGGIPSYLRNGAGGGGGESGGYGNVGGGGGGGYGSPGETGGHGSGGTSYLLGGEGGNAMGSPELQVWLMGGAGGSGGDKTDAGHYGGSGGSGGGIMGVFARSILVQDQFVSHGLAGSQGACNCGSGGSGAGGTINMIGQSVVIGDGYVSAMGGPHIPGNCADGWGGEGGAGRIHIGYSEVLSGSTAPLASVQHGNLHTGPLVTIHTVYPNPAVRGEDAVTFLGSAVDNDEYGDSITQYVWRSDLDGLLSTQATFTQAASELSAGTHMIYLKARDNEGEWSQEISATLAVTEAPVFPDDYEPDDLCAESNSISVDGLAQHHTFHDHGDQDWLQFHMLADTTYVIQTSDVGSQANTVLMLYDACGALPLVQDDDAFGSTARIVWTAPTDGTYYVRVNNHDPNQYGHDAYYDLSVRAQISGAAIVVLAGHNDDWDMQNNIDYCTNTAYRSFLLAGIPEEKLYYLNPNPGLQDPDGDGVYDDVDAVSSSVNLQYALETWAASQLGMNEQLFVYLMDHGAVDAFATDGSQDVTTPQMLDTWLTSVEDATGCVVNVIIEACHGGSFIDQVPVVIQEISEPGRVVITSTGREQNAYASLQGAYFSDAFWTSIQNSSNLWIAFQDAAAAVEAIGLWQTPWLDDNGNAMANDGTDGQVAAGRGLAALGYTGRPPVVDAVTVTLTAETQGIIQAVVRDDYGVQSVWAIVVPPSFQEPLPGDPFEWPELDLPEVELLKDGGSYARSYGGFDETGIYRIIVYARDGDGNQAVPRTTTVRIGEAVYLPLVARGFGR